MTKNELERLFHAARCMTLFASEIREELDAAVACALWGDSPMKTGDDIRRNLTPLVEGFIGSFEKARQEPHRNE